MSLTSDYTDRSPRLSLAPLEDGKAFSPRRKQIAFPFDVNPYFQIMFHLLPMFCHTRDVEKNNGYAGIKSYLCGFG